MKSEPDVYSIDHLKKDKITPWEGVRNYQARNFMTQDMKLNDLVLFYHSNCSPPGIAGIGKVCSPAKPDKTQFDSKSEFYDPKSTTESPRWRCIDVAFIEKFSRLVTLDELKNHKALKEMLVLRKGNRLSITPVQKAEFDFILKLAKSKV